MGKKSTSEVGDIVVESVTLVIVNTLAPGTKETAVNVAIPDELVTAKEGVRVSKDPRLEEIVITFPDIPLLLESVSVTVTVAEVVPSAINAEGAATTAGAEVLEVLAESALP